MTLTHSHASRAAVPPNSAATSPDAVRLRPGVWGFYTATRPTASRMVRDTGAILRDGPTTGVASRLPWGGVQDGPNARKAQRSVYSHAWNSRGLRLPGLFPFPRICAAADLRRVTL